MSVQPRTATGTNISRQLIVLGLLFSVLPFVLLLAPNYIQYCLAGGLLATPPLDNWRASYRNLNLSPITRAIALLFIWAFATTLWADAIRTEQLIELTLLSVLGLHLLFALRSLDQHERDLIGVWAILSFVAVTVLFLLITSMNLIFPVGVNWNPFDVRRSPVGPQSAGCLHGPSLVAGWPDRNGARPVFTAA